MRLESVIIIIFIIPFSTITFAIAFVIITIFTRTIIRNKKREKLHLVMLFVFATVICVLTLFVEQNKSHCCKVATFIFCCSNVVTINLCCLCCKCLFVEQLDFSARSFNNNKNSPRRKTCRDIYLPYL